MDVVGAMDHGHRRVRDGLAIEQRGERLLRAVVEVVLTPEEDDPVSQPRLPDLAHGGGVEIGAEAHAAHLRADPAGDGDDLEVIAALFLCGAHAEFSS
jgi:hypothetical protein